MLKTKQVLDFFNNNTYLKIMCCVFLMSGLYTVYQYKVVTPYNNLEKKYRDLEEMCAKAPKVYMEAGSTVIQSNLTHDIETITERMEYDRGKIKVEDNITTFTFTN